MMKRIKRIISVLVVCVIFISIVGGGGALAAVLEPSDIGVICIEPHASRYLSMYNVQVARGGNGSLVVNHTVIATARFDRVGVLLITIQQRVGASWVSIVTYSNATAPGLMGNNVVTHNGSFTHSGASGRELRAVVTVFAGNATGDQRTVTTGSVFV